MPPVLNLKPSHKAVKDYYAALARHEAEGTAGQRDLARLLVKAGLAQEWPPGTPKPEWCG